MLLAGMVALPMVAAGHADEAATGSFAARNDDAVKQGFAAYNKGDFVTAREIWLPLAQIGNAEAQYNLGVMYARGEALAQSDAKAVDWWRRAAAQGHAASMHNLGFMNATGRGGPANFRQAYLWYALAARLQPPGPLQDGSHAALGVISKKLAPGEVARLQPDIEGYLARLKTTKAAAPPPANNSPTVARTPKATSPALTSSATGFVVSATGYLLTNEHVIADCQAVQIRNVGPAVVKHRDKANDLAVLKVDRRFSSWAKFRDGRTIRPGDGVVVAGFPLPGLLTSDLNITVGNTSAMAGPGNDRRFLQITAPVQLGNSGGPLLDMSGHVVGVVVGKLDTVGLGAQKGSMPENVNFAINAGIARAFLSQTATPHDTALSQHLMGAADVGEIALNFTVAVECWR